MLIEFSVTNFRSFRERQTLSMVASSDDSLPNNVVEMYPDTTKSIKLLRAAAILGANASGKSNLLKAMHTAKLFVVGSATKYNRDDKILAAAPFRLDSNSITKPSEFEFVMALADGIYEYSFACTQQRVTEESLYLTEIGKGKKRHRLFGRSYDDSTEEYSFGWGKSLRSVKKLLEDRTRDNCLILSRAVEQNVKELTGPFDYINPVWIIDMSKDLTLLSQITADWCTKYGTLNAAVLSIIKSANTGIDSITIDTESSDHPIIKTVHTHSDNSSKSTVFSMLEDESTGTQRLHAIAAPFWSTLQVEGSTLVLDELDCSLHPLLSRGLIQLFQSDAYKNNNSQMIFTTHDSALIDLKLLRRDQVFLVDKNNSQASEIYSLQDFKPRKEEKNIGKRYLEGRYGGIPDLGPVFEDLEIPSATPVSEGENDQK